MSGFTEILQAIDAGKPQATEELLPLVYDELRKMAERHLASERPGQTLQATALVHEAWMRLVGKDREQAEVAWNSRGHFYAAAATAIRRILIENARRKHSQKRGGDLQRQPLDDQSAVILPEPLEDQLALDDALRKLAQTHPEAARVVDLLYFSGLTLPQAAATLGISERTAGRHWAYARAWLRRELEPEENSPGS